MDQKIVCGGQVSARPGASGILMFPMHVGRKIFEYQRPDMSHKEIKYIFKKEQKIAARKVESTSHTETRTDQFGERLFFSTLKS